MFEIRVTRNTKDGKRTAFADTVPNEKTAYMVYASAVSEFCINPYTDSEYECTLIELLDKGAYKIVDRCIIKRIVK